jgi:hypothetical protein
VLLFVYTDVLRIGRGEKPAEPTSARLSGIADEAPDPALVPAPGAQVEIGIGRLRIPPAIPHINLLIGVQHEAIESSIPIAIEQTNIDVVHPGDANAHVLAQLFAQWRIFR